MPGIGNTEPHPPGTGPAFTKTLPPSGVFMIELLSRLNSTLYNYNSHRGRLSSINLFCSDSLVFVYISAAGWYSFTIFRPFSSLHSPHPNSPLPAKAVSAVFPSRTITSGSSKRICSSRKGRQASSSLFFGLRLSGGRHFTVLITAHLSSPKSIYSIIRSSTFPALPQKGTPVASSFLPGASPIKSTNGWSEPLRITFCVAVS